MSRTSIAKARRTLALPPEIVRMAEIAEGVAAAAEGIVGEVRAVAVVHAAGAIAVLVVAEEIAATAKSANSH